MGNFLNIREIPFNHRSQDLDTALGVKVEKCLEVLREFVETDKRVEDVDLALLVRGMSYFTFRVICGFTVYGALGYAFFNEEKGNAVARLLSSLVIAGVEFTKSHKRYDRVSKFVEGLEKIMLKSFDIVLKVQGEEGLNRFVKTTATDLVGLMFRCVDVEKQAIWGLFCDIPDASGVPSKETAN